MLASLSATIPSHQDGPQLLSTFEALSDARTVCNYNNNEEEEGSNANVSSTRCMPGLGWYLMHILSSDPLSGLRRRYSHDFGFPRRAWNGDLVQVIYWGRAFTGSLWRSKGGKQDGVEFQQRGGFSWSLVSAWPHREVWALHGTMLSCFEARGLVFFPSTLVSHCCRTWEWITRWGQVTLWVTPLG